MKKKLLLLGLLSYSVAFGGDGLFGSDLHYQHAVLITTVGAVIYAFNTCKSFTKCANLLKHYVSLVIAGGAGLAVFYSDQFNNMVPEQLRVNQFCDGLNTVLPYWFGAVIAGATYSNFCDRYDAWFKPEKKEDENKSNFILGLKAVQ
jgi:hypothetical protein